MKGGMEEEAKGGGKRHQRIDPSTRGPGTFSPKKILTPVTSVIIKIHQNSVFISQNFSLAPPAPICKTLVIDIGDYGQDSEKASKLSSIKRHFYVCSSVCPLIY